MPDPTPPPSSSVPDHDHELELDVRAFLPEGSVPAAPGTGADPAPEADLAAGEGAGRAPEAAGGRAEHGAPVDAGTGGGPDPEPPAGGGAAPVDLEALAGLEADLAAVDRALAALDDGSYGRCEVCSAAIPADVLAADPIRRRCGDHAAATPA